MDRHLIAVVDDEQDLLDNYREFLEDQFDVETFHTPTAFLQAIPQLTQRKLRLLITDFKMPEMTGLEMVQQAHTQVPHIPFIILSGFLDKKTVMAAVAMGVFRLLEKPARPNDILEAVDQLILESELTFVREEIRQITSQLRELYGLVRLALLQYIPEDVIDRLVVEAPNGRIKRSMSFDDLLANLEQRLNQLLTSEKLMNDLKDSNLKNNSPS
jgi:FixJ family two-component response regulator